MTVYNLDKIQSLLGEDSDYLLDHTCATIGRDQLPVKRSHIMEEAFLQSNRSPQVLKSLGWLFNHGRLGGTGYLSILPVDQGVEHSAGSAFAPNPIYFDPENIIRLAIEGGCNGVATTFGGLALFSRKYAHRIPFIVKINHNQLLSYPKYYDQVLYGSVEEAWNLGATAVGATIYFGSEESDRQLQEVARAFEEAHALGMATILWCYTRNEYFKTETEDYHTAADLTGQAIYLGSTIQADLVKQKLPTTNGGFRDLNFGRTAPEVYDELSSEHPIDLCRYQVINAYMGRIGLINSGGASKGASDFQNAAKTAVINKRAGGAGLISGRKAFQRPFEQGVDLLHLIQDVYLNAAIDLA